MLAKLLKYEIKATSKIFIPMYIVMFLISIVNFTFRRNNVFMKVQNTFQTVIMALYIAIMVITIVIITERFRKNLLGNEGYLMFTLPVKPITIISSKFIGSLVWGSLSVLITFISAKIISNGYYTSTENIFFGEGSSFYIGDISISGIELAKNNSYIIIIVCILMLLLSMYSVFIFIIYSSLSIGQISIFSKSKDLMSIGAFLVVSLCLSIYYKFTNNIGFNVNSLDNLEFVDAFEKITTIGIINNIIVIGILFCITNYFLSKKLNLD